MGYDSSRLQQHSGLGGALMAGVVGAAVATAAVTLTNKEARKKVKKAFDTLIDSTDDVKNKADNAVQTIQKKVGSLASKAEEKAQRIDSK